MAHFYLPDTAPFALREVFEICFLARSKTMLPLPDHRACQEQVMVHSQGLRPRLGGSPFSPSSSSATGRKSLRYEQKPTGCGMTTDLYRQSARERGMHAQLHARQQQFKFAKVGDRFVTHCVVRLMRGGAAQRRHVHRPVAAKEQ